MPKSNLPPFREFRCQECGQEYIRRFHETPEHCFQCEWRIAHPKEPAPSECLKAHRVMTPEEYAALHIQGWHMVNRNVDGHGGVGLRYYIPETEDEANEMMDNGRNTGGRSYL